MTLNPSPAARTAPPFKTAVIVFAAAQIATVPVGHGIVLAAVVGGGCVAYNCLPESFREKVDSKYARAKQLLRERFAQASGKVRHTARCAAIRIQRIVANGVLIILIWAAYASESWCQFVETIRASLEVCSGKSVFAVAA
jgi:hypothetical protein